MIVSLYLNIVYCVNSFFVLVCFSEIEKFDVFGLGTQVYASHREKSAIEDRLHFFTEECDSLQVFLLFSQISLFPVI